jgi:Flp pilus assembly protein TadG
MNLISSGANVMLRLFRNWLKADEAAVAIEVGLLVPVMLMMLMGVIDIGEGVYINQKLIDADQMIADLLTRNKSVSAAVDLPSAYAAGQMTMAPYNITSFGVDVAGIKFINTPTNPQVQWRYTQNMVPNAAVPANAVNLGSANEGVVVVTTIYQYVPFFSFAIFENTTLSTYNMQEVAFARGRNGQFIPET